MRAELEWTDIFRRLAACHLGLVMQHAPRYLGIDGGLTELPPRLMTAAVGTIEGLGSDRIGDIKARREIALSCSAKSGSSGMYACASWASAWRRRMHRRRQA